MSHALSGPYPPPHFARKGVVPILERPGVRETTIRLACTGVSRRGIAQTIGVSTDALRGWLARGRAQPEVEPWGSWSVDFTAAERVVELTGAEVQTQNLLRIARKPVEERTQAEIVWVGTLLATRFPAEHGNASAGTGNARVLELEPDAEAWWQKHGLVGDQLRALLRDPPEELARALLLEGYVRKELDPAPKPSAG